MEPKSVGIWLRVSTDDQVENDSLEHHEARARSYADSKGWTVYTVYRLEAVSGKSVMHHAETKRMLKDAKDGNITGLIFSKLARLSRNLKELLEFSEIFETTKTDLISLGENIDTSSPAGRLFFSLSGIFGQYEREEISSRVAASVPIRAKLGKPLGGAASYGYQWKHGKLVVNDKEAPIRKLIYELFLKHRRKKSTAKELNDLGYRTRKGALWTGTTIERLIRDTTAKGEYRANYTKSTGDKKHWVYKDPSEWIITSCQAVVDASLWDECNTILDKQYKKRNPAGPKAVHLLAGFVYCTCGRKMYVYHENNVFACKPCKNRIPESDLEEIYHSQLKSFLLTDMDVTSYLAKSNKAVSEKEKLLKTITNESAKISKKMTELVNMRIGGELTKDAFLKHHKPLEDQLAQIQEQLPQLQGEIDALKVHSLSSEIILAEAKDLYLRWPQMQFEAKRSIVEVITESITIGKEDISLKLSYLPTSPPPAQNLILPIIVGKRAHNDVHVGIIITLLKNVSAGRG